MDHCRFDHLARVVSHGASRRQLLGLLAALTFTGRTRSSTSAQTVCAPGQADCGGVCIDTCCDNQNCGACGNVCTGGLTCFEGVCDCPSGLCVPSTGAGASGRSSIGASVSLALASVAAFVAVRLPRLNATPAKSNSPSPGTK